MHRTPIDVSLLSRSVLRHLDKVATAAVLIALAATTTAILKMLIVEERGTNEPFTEFYLLGSDGTAAGYPTALTAGEEASVILGILSQERQEAVYGVSLRINGGAAAEIGRARLSPRERWEQPVSFTLQQAGERQLVEFVLYMEGHSRPYRTLRLWVDGRPAVTAAEMEASPTPAAPIVAGQASSPVTATPAAEATPTPEPQPTVHIVSPGENLTLISHRYGVSLETVIKANAREIPNSNLIYPNQRILIPAEGR